ncbi:TetR/AcrR family transcriptional regulator [Clostridium sp. 'deep sea']|uniref:TetR/AcrR family transcriptional regulator n=1 Tax=Clostridium sp. 'deep sea' TaxID=2779445 RepID=UPI001896733A|nr:TetR/AcrR family transcriptional regulator [Clostridium sp. 'deep sea']QOR34937.1 TetR/AcrR family transcriptional regulator [Clostridium sp. 'deep sea']
MKPLNRTEKRKQETKDDIINAAIELLKNTNSTDLKLERVAEKADVTRKTIYNHFSSKEKLLSDIINPMLEYCIECVREINAEKITINDIANLCLKIYRKYGSKLNLMYNINFNNLKISYDLHKKYTILFIDLFKRIEDLNYHKVNHKNAAFIVFKMFVPLLNSLSNLDDYESLFNNALCGLLKGLE